MIKKDIPLPKGGTLELELTPKFLDILQTHFELTSADHVTDDHIRMYVWGAFKNAIEKAEREALAPHGQQDTH